MNARNLAMLAIAILLVGAGCSPAPVLPPAPVQPSPQPVAPVTPPQQAATETIPTVPTAPPPVPVPMPPANGLNSAGHTVTFDGTGFVPSVLTVKKGATVTFRNGSAQDMRIASNPHPIHNGYPTTGGCVGSTFDSCATIQPGGTWSFTFDIVGTWGYHDHLDPAITATIVVQ